MHNFSFHPHHLLHLAFRIPKFSGRDVHHQVHLCPHSPLGTRERRVRASHRLRDRGTALRYDLRPQFRLGFHFGISALELNWRVESNNKLKSTEFKTFPPQFKPPTSPKGLFTRQHLPMTRPLSGNQHLKFLQQVCIFILFFKQSRTINVGVDLNLSERVVKVIMVSAHVTLLFPPFCLSSPPYLFLFLFLICQTRACGTRL